MNITDLIQEGERLYNNIQKGTNLLGGTHFPEDVLDDNDFNAMILWRENTLQYLKNNCEKEIYNSIERLNCESGLVKNGVVKENILKIICKLKTKQ